MSLAGFTNQELAQKVEAAALLCPIAYLKHVRAPLLRLMVLLHIDTVRLSFSLISLNDFHTVSKLSDMSAKRFLREFNNNKQLYIN